MTNQSEKALDYLDSQGISYTYSIKYITLLNCNARYYLNTGYMVDEVRHIRKKITIEDFVRKYKGEQQ